MSERLNARLDAELARKLRYLQCVTGKTATQVVKDSLEAHYERVARGRGAAELLAGFVGVADGSEELSSNYKQLLSDSLDEKGA
jgi:predicted DNA-binding protein